MRRELLGYLVAALALGGTKCVYDRGQRQAGVLSERLRVADSTARVLARSVQRVDTLYRADTVRLTRRVQSWDTVTRTVAALPDTVRVPVEVVRWVVAEADSTIAACRSVIQTCEQRVAVRDSLIAALSRRNALIREQVRRETLKKWGERAVWAGLVVVVSK
jgi:hypothetical protein